MWLPATVVSDAQETASAWTLTLSVNGWTGHRAGQHMDVRLTAEDGYQAVRPYSIASAPGEPPQITVERLPRRRNSRRCFVCGPTNFVESVASTLVGLGHSPTAIRTERFGALS